MKQAEQLVEEERRRWRELLARGPAAVAVLRGPDHRYDWVNNHYLELIGKTAEELLGKAVLEVLPGMNGQVYVDLLNSVYQTGEPFVGQEFPLHLNRHGVDSQTLYVNFVYTPTRNNDGEIDGVFANFIDVTPAVLARRSVGKSERQFRTLIDSARDHAIIGMDIEGKVTSWNAGAQRLLGYCEQEILGEPAAIIFTEEDRREKAPEHEIETTREAGRATNERWHLRKDGTRFWGSGTLTAVRDTGDETNGFVKVFQDRTREVLAEEALRASEERFRQLADSMPQMVWTAEPDGHLDYYNRRWFDFTGFDPSLSGDEMWDRVLHPDDKLPCYRSWESSVESGQPYQIEYRLRDRHEDRWRWFMGRALAVHDASGKLVKWFGTCTDIDEQKTAQQALLQAQKFESIGLLAGGIAHDFNNLLVGIMGGASFALDTVPPSHPAYQMLQGVVEASERAAHLTRQMLAYAGKGRFVIEPVDLSAMALQTAKLVSASIPKLVQVRFELEENLPSVHTDPGQMQQVAMNLIINAGEAVEEGASGVVIVRTRAEEVSPGERRRDFAGEPVQPGEYAVLEVQDSGRGIEPGMLAKIFDPFFTTKFTGRGLGLAAVLGIVRSHRGALEVETEPGKGSTFRVMLPARHLSPRPKQAAPADSPGTEGVGNVLVIDDEAVVRNFASAALEKDGYTAILCESGEQGLDYIHHHADIAVVLLDMNMPGISGRQVLEDLKTLRPTLPVVICSGYSEEEVYRRFSGLEVAGVLQKPFTTKRLAEKVRSVLDAVGATQE